MNVWPWLLAPVIILAITWIVLASRRRERKRTEELQYLATAMDCTFEAAGDVESLRAIGDLPLFQRGHSKRVKNVMTARADADGAKFLDYQYTTGSGKNQHTSAQTVALFPRGVPSLPELVLAPENVFHKIGQAFGYKDIDFDSAPEFSTSYLLRGPDETAIRAAFHPDTLSFFAQHAGWTVEARNGTAAIYRAGKRCNPADMRTFIEDARRVRSALKRD